jgi:3-oxoacyl-[acyl-carrier protein] reductase
LGYCIVTGGSAGIGLQIARDMMSRGDQVVSWDIKPPPAENAPAFEHVDLTDLAAIRAAAARAPETVDTFVHCAGVLAATSIVADDLAEKMLLTFQVHLLAFVCGVQALLPKLTGPNASVIAITSAGQDMVYPGTIAYGASKAGLHRAITQLAVELGGSGIRVNGIAPGGIATDMTRHLWQDPAFAAERRKHIPLGRQAEPTAVSDAVAFLASPAASYVTGEILWVDGGVRHGIFHPTVRAFVDPPKSSS